LGRRIRLIDRGGDRHGAGRTEALTALAARPDLADARASGAATDRDALVAYVLDQLDQRGDA
jgi:hypothetical protein